MQVEDWWLAAVPMEDDAPPYATARFDSIRGMGLTAELDEGDVQRLKRHEDAAGLETLASGLGGGPVTSILTRKTKPVGFSKKSGLSFYSE